MKDTYYFSHDMNARSDPKLCALISDYGSAGYGIFWVIIEILHEEKDNTILYKDYVIKSIAKQSGAELEQVKEIIKSCIDEYELLKLKDDIIYSERVIRNTTKRAEIVEKKRNAGRKSAEARKENNPTPVEHKSTKSNTCSTPVQHKSTGVEHNATKETKLKETKGNKIKGNKKTSSSDDGENKITINDFEKFWELYPRKDYEGKARTKWENICTQKTWDKKRPTFRVIKRALLKQKETVQWQDVKYIPLPTTWLNQSRWKDDPAQMNNKNYYNNNQDTKPKHGEHSDTIKFNPDIEEMDGTKIEYKN
jgi:hypothetical protein